MLIQKLKTLKCFCYSIILLPFLVMGHHPPKPEIVVESHVPSRSDHQVPGAGQGLSNTENVAHLVAVSSFEGKINNLIKDMDEPNDEDPPYEIGLSMYSLRDLLNDGRLHVLDFPQFAKDSFGITNIDIYDGGLPENRRNDPEMYREIKREADKAGVNIFLLMGGVLNADGLPTESNKIEMET